MYGLAIIFLFFFSLILWIVLTRLAVKFGRKIFTRMLPQYGWAGKAGAFAGFMLLMGGWIVKWKIENWQAVRHAEEACKKKRGYGYMWIPRSGNGWWAARKLGGSWAIILMPALQKKWARVIRKQWILKG